MSLIVAPLFRYLSERNARAFVERGELLFRALSYFRDYEDDGVRADEHEGTLVHLPAGGLKVKRVPTGETIAVSQRFESTAKEDSIFVYCMSTEFSIETAQRFKSERVVEILDPLKLLTLLRTSLSLRRNLKSNKLVYDRVHYYNWDEPPIADWALPERIAMRKPKVFEWQKEFRFAVPVGDAFDIENVRVKLVEANATRQRSLVRHPELLLKLGNLSKISRIHKI